MMTMMMMIDDNDDDWCSKMSHKSFIHKLHKSWPNHLKFVAKKILSSEICCSLNDGLTLDLHDAPKPIVVGDRVRKYL